MIWTQRLYVAAACAVFGVSGCLPDGEHTNAPAMLGASSAAQLNHASLHYLSKTAVRAEDVQVVDGDTIALGSLRVRLHGIDTPELSQTCPTSQGETWRCGVWAKDVLTDMIARTPQSARVACYERDVDRYGRSVGTCFSGDLNLNAALVEQGAAIAYKKYSTEYVELEQQAQAASLGLWSEGGFGGADGQTPAQYRASQRDAQLRKIAQDTQEAPEGCLIKGNISKSGRIYHLPGSSWYGRTSVNEAQGERWFCSQEEARAAGWRPSQG